MNPILSIIEQFPIKGTVDSANPFGNGHINDTYFVKTQEADCPDYVLQRKNHAIFKNVPAMMDNIDRVCQHIGQKLVAAGDPDAGRKTMHHLRTYDGELYHLDADGNYWALSLFVENSTSYDKIDRPEMAELAGIAFGRFQNQLADLEGEPLYETIKDFHNIYFRESNFEKACSADPVGRLKEVAEEVETIVSRLDRMKTLQRKADAGTLPLRVTHNDTKINNVLFDRDTDKMLAVIDLDTVMPGLVHFDFGDAIRTAANTGGEDEADLSKVDLNMDVFYYFAKGFLAETKNTLTEEEIDLIPLGCQFMTYIMALRFLTDYIDGDTYYKIKYPEHNIVRARNQIHYLKCLEAAEPQMQEMISSLVKA